MSVARARVIGVARFEVGGPNTDISQEHLGAPKVGFALLATVAGLTPSDVFGADAILIVAGVGAMERRYASFLSTARFIECSRGLASATGPVLLPTTDETGRALVVSIARLGLLHRGCARTGADQLPCAVVVLFARLPERVGHAAEALHASRTVHAELVERATLALGGRLTAELGLFAATACRTLKGAHALVVVDTVATFARGEPTGARAADQAVFALRVVLAPIAEVPQRFAHVQAVPVGRAVSVIRALVAKPPRATGIVAEVRFALPIAVADFPVGAQPLTRALPATVFVRCTARARCAGASVRRPDAPVGGALIGRPTGSADREPASPRREMTRRFSAFQISQAGFTVAAR